MNSESLNSESYFIRNDYVPNRSVRTNDNVTGDHYWSPERLRGARYYQFPVYRYAQTLVSRHNVSTLVDVGCGPAPKLQRLHQRFPQLRIVGIDQPHPIAYCKNAYNFGEWTVDDFANPSHVTTSIRGDLVVCADVIEHVADPGALLEYLKRFLAPSGRLLLSTPERDILHGPHCTRSPNPDHVREWNRRELRALVEHHGYHVQEHFLALPVKVNLSRIFFDNVCRRLLHGKDPRTNQVLLLELNEH